MRDALLDGDRRSAGAEEVGQADFRPPADGRLEASRRRDVAAHDLEELAAEALGNPAAQPDPPAGTTHPQQLARGALLIGREHDAEDRQHDIEVRVGELQRLRVADPEVDRRALGSRAQRRPLDERRHVVDPRDVAVAARRGQRRVAAAAGDVEHALTRVRVARPHERLAHRHDLPGQLVEVARRPRRLLTRRNRAIVDSHIRGS